jgi:hypothetical protein
MSRQTLERFYTAFQQLDGKAMQACYAPTARFDDEAFSLQGALEIGAMWRMLCEATQTQGREHWRLDFQIGADGCSAHWEAHYLFSATGRLVHNRIDATFRCASRRPRTWPATGPGDPEPRRSSARFDGRRQQFAPHHGAREQVVGQRARRQAVERHMARRIAGKAVAATATPQRREAQFVAAFLEGFGLHSGARNLLLGTVRAPPAARRKPV